MSYSTVARMRNKRIVVGRWSKPPLPKRKRSYKIRKSMPSERQWLHTGELGKPQSGKQVRTSKFFLLPGMNALSFLSAILNPRMPLE